METIFFIFSRFSGHSRLVHLGQKMVKMGSTGVFDKSCPKWPPMMSHCCLETSLGHITGFYRVWVGGLPKLMGRNMGKCAPNGYESTLEALLMLGSLGNTWVKREARRGRFSLSPTGDHEPTKWYSGYQAIGRRATTFPEFSNSNEILCQWVKGLTQYPKISWKCD